MNNLKYSVQTSKYTMYTVFVNIFCICIAKWTMDLYGGDEGVY